MLSIVSIFKVIYFYLFYSRSFLGITAHWICVLSLERKSACIALRRAHGSHTSEALSEIIERVLIEYNIITKVVKVVTDNGANFVKAFTPASENKKTKPIEDNARVVDLTKILKNASNVNIPLHQRCASHTLNLTMTSDLKKALKQALKEGEQQNEEEFNESIFENEDFDKDVSIIDSAVNYRNASTIAFKKCKDLWCKQSRSTLAADTIKDKLGLYLEVPNDTRWNAELDGTKQMLFFVKEKPNELRAVFKALQLEYFTQDDITFLESYISVRILFLLYVFQYLVFSNPFFVCV